MADVENGATNFLNLIKLPYFSCKEEFDLDLPQIAGAPVLLTSEKELATNLSDPNHFKPKNQLCERFAYVKTHI